MTHFEPVVTPKERCDECGFVYADVSPDDAVARLRSFGRRYRAPLTRFLAGEDGGTLLRQRPEEGVWSALEYAAHVRDAIRFNGYLARRTLTDDRPTLPAPNPDQAAVDNNYNDEDAAEVAAGIEERAEKLAAMVEANDDPSSWERTAEWDGRDGDFTAIYFVRNAVHEGHHHLLDVGRVLRTVRGR
ncbi:MAG: DinB family protein [Actinobacteria bacterium]|nr:MAG: DinB family protein [Actinomycetota bacterium]